MEIAAPGSIVEQRRHVRQGFKVNRLIRASFDFGDDDQREMYIYLVDLSEGGLRVNADTPFPTEKPFILRFTLQYVEVDVVVRAVWEKNLAGGTWTAGLAFHEPTPEQTEQIRAMVEAYAVAGRRERYRQKTLMSGALRLQEDADWFYTSLVDVSTSGLRVCWDEPLDMETEVFVHLRPPDLDEVDARATVVWQKQINSERFEVGLRFSSISDEAVANLQKYIDACVGTAEA